MLVLVQLSSINSFLLTYTRSTGNTLVELHQFFEDDPDDYRLEMEAEVRLKALYSCLVNATSRTMLQIGLSGLLTYVKASQRSSTIDELLISKDYISEIITIAADHFTTAPLLSATCLYECMLRYPKKFSPFLINKFRPLLPRIIYKKTSGPSEICCKCIAHLSVLGIPSASKQAKSWKNEYDRYLKIASLLIDQIYSGVNDCLCTEVTDIETTLIAEIGDVISSTDHATIFSNCCNILRYLFYVHLDSQVTVPCERTFKIISKVISINSQQFNALHRKHNLPTLLGSCVQLCDTLVTYNPSSFMFNIRSIFALFISLLDLVRPQAEYLTLSINIYQLLTNLLAIFHRQVRIDVDILQKLIRWIINDSTVRTRSKVPVAYLSRPDHQLSQAAMNCTQQLLNIYSDHMPKDQYSLIQNHFIQTLMICQASSIINKPYDNELCRVGLYNILECLLINERADCSTIIAISKDLIDNAVSLDSSVKVKMAVRKLKLVWQQVNDSTSHLYQPWSFLNVDKPRKVLPNNINSSMKTSELRNVFITPSMPMISNIESSSISMMNTEHERLMHSLPISKPSSVHQTPMETAENTFLQAPPPMTYSTLDVLLPSQQSNLETFVQPMNEHHKDEYNRISEQHRKRPKLVDTRPVEIDDDNDDDGAEQIFANESDNGEHDNEQMDDYDEEEEDEEMDESDEIDDEVEDDGRSEISSDDDDDVNERMVHTNGIKKFNQYLGTRQSNVDLLGISNAQSEAYLQTMNDNLHKKFRRQNHVDQHYPSVHPTSTDFSHNNNNNDQIYFPSQLNGDHKNNTNKPANGNGPILSKNGGDDDDDDIVLVSDDDNDDDDDSVDKKSETKNTSVCLSEPTTYIADIPATFTETATTTATTIVTNDASSAKDLLEDIDRSSCGHAIRIEISSVDNSATSLTLAIQETLESLRDAVNLVSDDYAIFNEEHN
ncbi:unnamed protein product [Rotaria magnacalcarata]|uniref:Uncharacterized protein n=3 Tax=Rotaria magnacalcarata TaxID=392030 RepID=A0A814LRM1_9BILA|nr:unnamed protein product [Rotaria magnacalcarata]CAF1443338.1 unnamed protein product [Rotaria magnacalcarata]